MSKINFILTFFFFDLNGCLVVYQESLYSFMRFPRAYGFHSDSVNFKSRLPECYSHDLDFSSNVWEMYISFLEKMVTFQSDINAAKVIYLTKPLAKKINYYLLNLLPKKIKEMLTFFLFLLIFYSNDITSGT